MMTMATTMRARGQRKVAMRNVAAMDKLLHMPFTAKALSERSGNREAMRAGTKHLKIHFRTEIPMKTSRISLNLNFLL